MAKTNWIMLFAETIAVCFENHIEHTKIHCVGKMQIVNDNEGGKYSHQCDLKVYITETYTPLTKTVPKDRQKERNKQTKKQRQKQTDIKTIRSSGT